MTDDRATDLPALSIRRPWLVIVINLLIVIAGVTAWLGVEVRELPNIDRPIVAVRANFPGAAPETLDAEVTRLLEGAAARVPGVAAGALGQRRGQPAHHHRVQPQRGPGGGGQRCARRGGAGAAQPARRAGEPHHRQGRRRCRAGDAAGGGQRHPGHRRALARGGRAHRARADFGARRGRHQPVRFAPAGDAGAHRSGAPERLQPGGGRRGRLVARCAARCAGGQSVVGQPGRAGAGQRQRDHARAVAGAAVSLEVALAQVADVFLAPADAESYVRLNDKPVVSLGVVRQAQSNSVAISDGVRAVVDRINASQRDVRVSVVSDDAVFIRGAISEVLWSLGLAVLIVAAVVAAFLGHLRSTLVPVVAIPIALIGTLAAIWALGYSINLLTLLALLLATGLVVDDAIVVLENIQRRRAMGLGPRAAAVLGTREVFFAVVATTLTLVAVFVPISFLPSAAGRLFAEFGFVMAIAVGISSFVALVAGADDGFALARRRAARADLEARVGLGRCARCSVMAAGWRRALRHGWWVAGMCRVAGGAGRRCCSPSSTRSSRPPKTGAVCRSGSTAPMAWAWPTPTGSWSRP